MELTILKAKASPIVHLGLALAVFAGPVWAQEQKAKGDPADANSSAAAIKPSPPARAQSAGRQNVAPQDASSGGSQEGIKVHGHWTIEVRNPDGKLVTHREFENSLAFDGPLNLATALGGAATVGLWRIEVDFANFPAGPCLSNNSPSFCLIHQNTDTNVPSQPGIDFFNLTVSAPFRPDPNAGKLTLNGTITVATPGAISDVGTALGGCAPSVATANCTLGPAFNSFMVLGFSAFSVATVSPAINVAVGQLLQVTVVFSFS